ncbi:COMM domain containing 2 L homeolog isoform X1 [Xenopus laevis]|uniref:COMM domain containing 2 L homeolog isoform X1 n=1 Tax=Xenopus laevis TaxID=8355 RepID=A0A8J0V510_XENLA|nr:COMM domain containing 2 L homeolog isoform X1 [Xenopus laevis]
MLLVLSEEHREHLQILTRVGGAVVGEFGRIAIEFLRRGSNPKVYEGAARKLEVSSTTIQQAVEGLTYLLCESSKLMISEFDFQHSVLVLGFPEEINKVLLQLYLDNRKEICQILTELEPDLSHYHNMEWRLDVQLFTCTQQGKDQRKNPKHRINDFNKALDAFTAELIKYEIEANMYL